MQRFIYFLLLITPFVSYTQTKINLVLNSDSIRQITSSYSRTFNDSLETNKYLNQLRLQGIKKGYLLTSIDTKRLINDTLYCTLFIGPKIKHTVIKYKPNDAFWIQSHHRQREQLLTSSVFNSNEVYELLVNCENNLIDNGYPFAQTSLINISFQSDTLLCELDINKNKYFTWGEIINRGDYILPDRLSGILLGIKKNSPYSENDKNNISSHISKHSYLEESQPFEILFNNTSVDIYLYLKSKPISSASGTIGLQQNTNNNGYTLIGDFRLKLVNLLKYAENLDINWKNLQNNSQSLKSSLSLPSILRTPFGTELQFQLFKRDTSFLELKSAISAQYLLNNGSTFKINYKHLSSSVLNTSISDMSIGNVSSNYYGFSLQKSKIDYLPCPTKGFLIYADISLGIRNTEDKLLSRTRVENTSKTEININYYLSITKRNIIKLIQSTEIFSAPSYFQNELIRFGGLNSQRGFREEELRSTSRIFGSIEYRFLLDKNSYLFLFYDQSWYENKIATTKRDTPFGLGSGLSFGTDIGIFSISYGIGKQLNNPLLIKNGNIHFGYISYF
jgi:hypothetical protein